MSCSLLEHVVVNKMEHAFGDDAHADGCGWGYDQDTFEKRTRHYTRLVFDGECQYLDWAGQFTEEELNVAL